MGVIADERMFYPDINEFPIPFIFTPMLLFIIVPNSDIDGYLFLQKWWYNITNAGHEKDVQFNHLFPWKDILENLCVY